jgi:hypothetical protein
LANDPLILMARLGISLAAINPGIARCAKS